MKRVLSTTEVDDILSTLDEIKTELEEMIGDGIGEYEDDAISKIDKVMKMFVRVEI